MLFSKIKISRIFFAAIFVFLFLQLFTLSAYSSTATGSQAEPTLTPCGDNEVTKIVSGSSNGEPVRFTCVALPKSVSVPTCGAGKFLFSPIPKGETKPELTCKSLLDILPASGAECSDNEYLVNLGIGSDNRIMPICKSRDNVVAVPDIKSCSAGQVIEKTSAGWKCMNLPRPKMTELHCPPGEMLYGFSANGAAICATGVSCGPDQTLIKLASAMVTTPDYTIGGKQYKCADLCPKEGTFTAYGNSYILEGIIDNVQGKFHCGVVVHAEVSDCDPNEDKYIVSHNGEYRCKPRSELTSCAGHKFLERFDGFNPVCSKLPGAPEISCPEGSYFAKQSSGKWKCVAKQELGLDDLIPTNCEAGEVLTKTAEGARCVPQPVQPPQPTIHTLIPANCEAGEVLTKTAEGTSCVPKATLDDLIPINCKTDEMLTKTAEGTKCVLKATLDDLIPVNCKAGKVLTKTAGGAKCVTPRQKKTALHRCPSGTVLTGLNEDGSAKCQSPNVEVETMNAHCGINEVLIKLSDGSSAVADYTFGENRYKCILRNCPKGDPPSRAGYAHGIDKDNGGLACKLGAPGLAVSDRNNIVVNCDLNQSFLYSDGTIVGCKLLTSLDHCKGEKYLDAFDSQGDPVCIPIPPWTQPSCAAGSIFTKQSDGEWDCSPQVTLDDYLPANCEAGEVLTKTAEGTKCVAQPVQAPQPTIHTLIPANCEADEVLTKTAEGTKCVPQPVQAPQPTIHTLIPANCKTGEVLTKTAEGTRCVPQPVQAPQPTIHTLIPANCKTGEVLTKTAEGTRCVPQSTTPTIHTLIPANCEAGEVLTKTAEGTRCVPQPAQAPQPTIHTLIPANCKTGEVLTKTAEGTRCVPQPVQAPQPTIHTLIPANCEAGEVLTKTAEGTRCVPQSTTPTIHTLIPANCEAGEVLTKTADGTKCVLKTALDDLIPTNCEADEVLTKTAEGTRCVPQPAQAPQPTIHTLIPANCEADEVLTKTAEGTKCVAKAALDDLLAGSCGAGEVLTKTAAGLRCVAPPIQEDVMRLCPSGTILTGLNGDGSAKCGPPATKITNAYCAADQFLMKLSSGSTAEADYTFAGSKYKCADLCPDYTEDYKGYASGINKASGTLNCNVFRTRRQIALDCDTSTHYLFSDRQNTSCLSRAEIQQCQGDKFLSRFARTAAGDGFTPECSSLAVEVETCPEGSYFVKQSNGKWQCIVEPELALDDLIPTNCGSGQVLTKTAEGTKCVAQPTTPTIHTLIPANCGAGQVLTKTAEGTRCVAQPTEPTIDTLIPDNCGEGQVLTKTAEGTRCVAQPIQPTIHTLIPANCSSNQVLTKTASGAKCVTKPTVPTIHTLIPNNCSSNQVLTKTASGAKCVNKPTGTTLPRCSSNQLLEKYGSSWRCASKLTVNTIHANAYYYRSDENIKKDIQKITYPLEKLYQLNGYMFKFKENDKPAIGVIAQEVERVFPEVVVTNEYGYKDVDYASLIALLIESIKKINDKIDEQNKEIESLKERLNQE